MSSDVAAPLRWLVSRDRIRLRGDGRADECYATGAITARSQDESPGAAQPLERGAWPGEGPHVAPWAAVPRLSKPEASVKRGVDPGPATVHRIVARAERAAS
jgi:hypothetical protein